MEREWMLRIGQEFFRDFFRDLDFDSGFPQNIVVKANTHSKRMILQHRTHPYVKIHRNSIKFSKWKRREKIEKNRTTVITSIFIWECCEQNSIETSVRLKVQLIVSSALVHYTFHISMQYMNYSISITVYITHRFFVVAVVLFGSCVMCALYFVLLCAKFSFLYFSFRIHCSCGRLWFGITLWMKQVSTTLHNKFNERQNDRIDMIDVVPSSLLPVSRIYRKR